MRTYSIYLSIWLCFSLVPSAQALDLSKPGAYRCVTGDCLNGNGTVYDVYSNGQTIEGAWQNGTTIPGKRYLVRHPLIKDKSFEQFYANDGLLDHGSMILNLGATNSASVFTGTFAHVDHPFLHTRVAVPLEGVYRTGANMEYRGRFQYLPAKGEGKEYANGYFVFFGDKVDLEDGTKETGMFASNGSVTAGAQIMFVRAQPEYMAVLQERYQQDLKVEVANFKPQQDTAAIWKKVFSILASGASNMPGIKTIGGSSITNNKFAMDLVSGVMNNRINGESKSPEEVSGWVDKLAKGSAKGMGDKLIKQAAGSGLVGQALSSGFGAWVDAPAQAQAQVPAQSEPQPELQAGSPNPTQNKGTKSGGCGSLSGKWTHSVGGTWTFSENQATLVTNSLNYGAAAQQITVLNLSSCNNGTMTYKIGRAALINTVDPRYAYDKTPANAPQEAAKWSQVHNQAYSISGNGLKFGNYTYTKR